MNTEKHSYRNYDNARKNISNTVDDLLIVQNEDVFDVIQALKDEVEVLQASIHLAIDNLIEKGD